MIKYIVAFVFMLLPCASGAYAQLAPWPQVAELDKTNVYFACNVSKLTVVYMFAEFELAPNEDRRTIKSVDVSEIETASRPGKGMRQFLDFAAGYEVTIDHGAAKPPSIKLESRKGLAVPVLALKQIILQELPFAKEMWGKEASVFELQYQERDNVDRLIDRKPLSVWVTIDGTCSSITLDGWTVQQQTEMRPMCTCAVGRF